MTANFLQLVGRALFFRKPFKLYRPDGTLQAQITLKRGEEAILHTHDLKGGIEKTSYYRGKKLHREDGPAEIRYYEDGSPETESYYKDGLRHREDGPAWITYFEEGGVAREQYLLNYNHHREDGPAILDYHPNGHVRQQIYCKNNKRHREDGPAVVGYDSALLPENASPAEVLSTLTLVEFWIEGVYFNFWEFLDRSSSEVQASLLRDWLPYVSQHHDFGISPSFGKYGGESLP